MEFRAGGVGPEFMLQALSRWGIVHLFNSSLVPGTECSMVNEMDTWANCCGGVGVASFVGAV